MMRRSGRTGKGKMRGGSNSHYAMAMAAQIRNPKEIRDPKADSASSPFNLNSAVDLTAKNAKITKTDSYAWIA